MSNFAPSKYQKKIFDFISTNTKNAVVSAVAGSGKTTTLIKALDQVPETNSVLFLAFNVSIVDELQKRLEGKKNICVSTVHKFGFDTLRNNLLCDKNTQKYRDIFKQITNEYFEKRKKYITNIVFDESHYPYVEKIYQFISVENLDVSKFINNCIKLCDLSRSNYVNLEIKAIGVGEINTLAVNHGISNEDGESTVTWYLAKLGAMFTHIVDFTDMIFLPNILNLKCQEFDFVFIDECQDLNACQRLIMQRAIKPETGRFIAVGDPRQAIYGFAGADCQSYEKLKSLPNTVELPLSFTYRVSPEILNLVKHINPSIIAHSKNKKGRIDNNSSYKDILDGDMVLCRNTFPLVVLCIRLLQENKKTYIIGSDIGGNLKSLISKFENQVTPYTIENVIIGLMKEREEMIEKIMSSHNVDRSTACDESSIVIFSENIKVIEALSDGIENPLSVIEKIDNIFSKDTKTGICLSTMHKSKGLESERVFILHPELIPSKYAKLSWQLEQEKNLEYVAYTRAKTFLGFITDFDAFKEHKSKSYDTNKLKVSKHVGTISKKMWLSLIITNIREIDSKFGGKTFVYDMVDGDGNVFSKFDKIDNSFLDDDNETDRIVINSRVSFYAIIKSHGEFKGVKCTTLGKLSHY